MVYDAWEWFVGLLITYLFKASVLDAQFLSIDKIKQLSILFSKGRNEEKEIRGLSSQHIKTVAVFDSKWIITLYNLTESAQGSGRVSLIV